MYLQLCSSPLAMFCVCLLCVIYIVIFEPIPYNIGNWQRCLPQEQKIIWEYETNCSEVAFVYMGTEKHMSCGASAVVL